MIISVGSITANATLGITTFTANADKVIEKAFKVQGSLNGIAQQAAAAGRTFTIMAVGGTLAAKQLGGSFIKAASDMEDYTTVMTGITKSTEETTRFIKDLTHFAAATPFELNEIISSATVLTSTFKGNTDEIRRWLPALAELGAVAKLRKIDFETMTLQFNRMITQGAGAVDLFRDAGILSMLGVDANIDKDIVKLREKVFKALTDPEGMFKGMAEKLAGTFSGLLSQVADQWFIFRNEVMNQSGLFDSLKEGLQKFLVALTQNRKGITDYIVQHKEMVETVIIGTAAFLAFAAGMTALGFIIPPLTVSFGLLTSGLKLMNIVLTGVMIKMGLAATAATPMSVAIIALTVAGAGSVYMLRSMGVGIDDLKRQFSSFVPVVNLLKNTFDGLSTGLANSSLALDSIFIAAMKTHRGFMEARKSAQDTLGISKFLDTSNSDAAIADITKKIDFAQGEFLAKTISTGKTLSGEWDRISSEIGKNSSAIAGFLGENIWDQVKKDTTAGLNFLGDKFPQVKKLMTDAAKVDLKQVDYTGLLGMPDFTQPGMKLGEGMKKGVDKAAKELERLKEQGQTVFENLFPAEGTFNDVLEKIKALTAIGKASPEAMSRIQADIIENFKGTNTELLEVENRLLGVGGAAAMVGDSLLMMKENAAIEDINLQAQEALAQFSTWQYAVDQFNERLENLKITAEGMDKSLDPEDITNAFRELADSLGVDTTQELEKLEKQFQSLGAPAKKVLTEIRDKIKETKVNALNDGIMDFTRAVGGLGPKFRVMASAAESAFRIVRAAQAAASMGFTEILALVTEIISAMGLLGGESEKSMSDMDKFMDDLASTAEAVADRMTDAIVEFARTGKAEIGDLVDFILQEFLRAGVSNLIVNPAVDFIGDAFFAKGGAFDRGRLIPAEKGHVTSGPELFQFRSGQTGVRGEAGTEAILPLKRTGGILGVQATGGPAPIVNVYNNALPADAVQVNHSNQDGQSIVDIILNVVGVGMMDGSLDFAMKGMR